MDLSAADPDVLILVGTQTGNSEIVADAVAERLGGLGFAVHVLDMAEAFPEMLADYRQILFVTCTWSEGTDPDNAVEFMTSFAEQAPDLSHAAAGVIGLGDRDYDPVYQTAALRLAGRLEAFGARLPLPLWEIDGGPTAAQVDAAVAWAEGWAARLGTADGGRRTTTP